MKEVGGSRGVHKGGLTERSGVRCEECFFWWDGG